MFWTKITSSSTTKTMPALKSLTCVMNRVSQIWSLRCLWFVFFPSFVCEKKWYILRLKFLQQCMARGYKLTTPTRRIIISFLSSLGCFDQWFFCAWFFCNNVCLVVLNRKHPSAPSSLSLRSRWAVLWNSSTGIPNASTAVSPEDCGPGTKLVRDL